MNAHENLDVETLVDLFEASCQRRGAAPLFGTRRGETFQWTSYADTHERVARVRLLLHSLGVASGDRVAIIADNCEEWAHVCYATMGLGAILVPLYTSQHADDWEYILQDCQASVLFVATRKVATTLSDMRPRLSSVKHVIAIDGGDTDPDSLSSRLNSLVGSPPAPRAVQPNEPACYIYTSGTMGRPKGVILSHGNIVFNVKSSLSTFSINENDCTLAFLPWAHAFGQTADLHVMVHVGCRVAINGDISGLLTNLQIVKPTILVAVPRVFCRLYEAVKKQVAHRSRAVRYLFQRGVSAATRRSNGQPLSWAERTWLATADKLIFERVRERFGGKLRIVISGSAALSRDVGEFVNAVGINFYEGYGLSEASPIVAFNNPTYRRFGTVGKPIPGVTVRIDTSVSPDPTIGEILVKGPNVMQGYRGLPEETRRAITPGGELRTGDLGRLDADGFLIVTGRIKEQFKLTNGKYVAPTPVEEKVKESSLVANCMLYGADQPYCVLIVVPDQTAIAKAAAGVPSITEDVMSERAVYRLIKKDVASLTAEFTPFVRPKKLLVLEEDFTIENGLLTPSQKVRRHAVIEKYQHRLKSLYSDVPGATSGPTFLSS